MRARLVQAWRRPAVPLLVVAGALVAVLVGTGVALTDVLEGSAVARADLEAVEDLAAERSPGWDAVTTGATWLANTLFVVLALVVAVATARRLTGRWPAPVFLVVAVGGEKAVYLAASLVVSRDRPPVPTTGFVHASSSYPSGHVGAAVVLYGAVAVLVLGSSRAPVAVRAAALAVAVTVPLLVAFARLYRGLHYPSDVLAGAFTGAVWLAAAWWSVLRVPGTSEGGSVA